MAPCVEVVEVPWHSTLASTGFVRSLGTSTRLDWSRLKMLGSINPFRFCNTTSRLLDGWTTESSWWFIRCATSWSAAQQFGFPYHSCDQGFRCDLFQKNTPFIAFGAYLGPQYIVQLRLEEFINSNRFAVCGAWLGFVQLCVQLLNIISFDVKEAYFIWWSIELRLKVCLVEKKDGNVVLVIVSNRFS